MFGRMRRGPREAGRGNASDACRIVSRAVQTEYSNGMATIGVIGVGLLGSAIGDRLSAAGHTVLGYDLLPERRRGAQSSQEVVSKCRVVLLCLPTSDVVAQVIGSLELSAGVTIVDCTTGDPETMAAM